MATKKEVLKKIQEKAMNKSESIKILKSNEYPDGVREPIKAMILLGENQIRPLILAVSKYFNK